MVEKVSPRTPVCRALLKALPRIQGNDLVFPGTSKSGQLSENTLNQVIKRLDEIEAEPSDSPGRPAVGS